MKKDNFLYSDEYETGTSSQEEANETRITKAARMTIDEIDIEERESEKENEERVESEDEERGEEEVNEEERESEKSRGKRKV